METFATIFAGLGLFVIGLNGLTKGMRSLNSRGLHKLVESSTSNTFLSSIVGIFTGIVTQSATAVTFIVVSMVSSGMIGLLQGLFITAWANIGTASLVFVAMLDIHVYLYLFIGLLGGAYYLGLDRREPHNSYLPVLVSLSLLMLGLLLIKQGSIPLKESAFLLSYLGDASQQTVLLFAAGLLITLITQSASSTSAIVITLASTGVFDFYQSCSLILGANFGAGLSVYFVGRHLLGSAKKIVLIQALNKFSGVVLLMPIFIYETHSGTPIIGLINYTSGSVLLAITLFVFLIQLCSALSMSLLAKQAICLVDRIAEQDLTEETRRPKYLHKHAIDDIETALDLLEKEQFRVISFFSALLDKARDEKSIVEPQAYAESVKHLIMQCDAFCVDLINNCHHSIALESALQAKERNDILLDIHNNLIMFAKHVDVECPEKTTEVIRTNLLEGLHFVLLFLNDAKNNQDDVESLITITDDKSAIMQRARESLIKTRQDNSSDALANMLAATTQFERLVWLINSYAQKRTLTPLLNRGQI